MPKIPTFTSQARPTAEIGTVKSNLQVPLSQTVAGALEPLTDALVKRSIQETDIHNKTQALRLENDYNAAMQTVTEGIVTNPNLATNQELSQKFLLEQSEINRQKFAAQADNRFSKTMFLNNSLMLDQKYSNKLRKDVSKSILIEADTQFNVSKARIFTDALMPDNSDFNRRVLEQDLENLYYTSFFGKVDASLYNSMVSNIPNEIYGYEITKGLSSNPNETFTKLLDNESYPGLDFKLRTKFIDKGKLILTNPLKLKLNNAIFGLQFQGRSEEVDLPFAKSVLTTEDFNQFKTRYSVAKDNAADVRAINTLPFNEINDYISNKKYTDNDYVGVADLITQQELLTGLQKAANNRNKFMLSDPAGFINSTNPEIKELFNNFLNSANNMEDQIRNRRIYNSAVVAEQIKMSGNTAVLKVATKEEIKNIQAAFSDKNTKAEKKIGLIQQLKTLHGPEHMIMVARHLKAEGASEEMLMAISTNSTSLSADLFSSSSTKELIELTKINEAEASTILGLIGDKTEDYQLVVSSQGETIESTAEHNLQVNKGIYKSVLLRIARGETIEDAVESASQDFLNDFTVNDEKTMFTPVDVMGVTVPLQASDIKRQGIIDAIKFTDVLDTFMGEDGYAHLATMTNGENLTEEEIRKKILFTARNYPRWINNGDMTGAVLQYELSGANRDIVNSKGQRIEFYFTDQPNQNPDIKSTEFTFPYLPNEILPVANDVDTVGAIEYGSDQLATDSDVTSLSNEDFNKQFIGIENQTASSGMIMSDANNNTNVSTLTNTAFNSSDLRKRIKKHEGVGKNGLYVPYIDSLGNLTVGYGHLLPKGSKKTKYTQTEIDNFFEEDLKIATKRVNKLGQLNKINLNTINQNAYDILVEMALNMGSNPNAKGDEKKGLFGFTKTLEAIKNGKYSLASEHMLYNFEGKDYKDISTKKGKTDWYKQVKETRATTLQKLMAKIPDNK